MELTREYADYAAKKALELLAIDSPTGFTAKAIAWCKKEFENLGCECRVTNKGALCVTVGGEDNKNGLLVEVHTDTLGAMISEIKGSGCLKLTNLGGLKPANVETENVRVYTRDGRVYEGTVQLHNPSGHVNGAFDSTVRSWDTVEVVLDENVKSAADVRALGIENGDFVCMEPRAHITESGYIKSRFLDDKLSVGIFMALVKFIRDNNVNLNRRLYGMVTVYEEVGHGGAANIPADVTEVLSVDMGCVGDGLMCTEREVSICAKDSGGPYDYTVTDKLVKAARREGAAYAIDTYPMYGSDAEVTLRAGNDVRHGCLGSGVFASHGYERSHVDGVFNTLKTLKGYLEI